MAFRTLRQGLTRRPKPARGSAQNRDHRRVADHSDVHFVEAADRYASAAFDLALEANALAALESDVGLLAAALKESADLRSVAASPVIGLDEKSKAFAAIAARLGLSQLGVNVVGVIVRNGRSAALPAFIKAVRARLAAHRGARTVEIVSAAPLDAAQLQTIVSGLSRVLGANVEPVTKVDPSLIGGFIARAGSRQFDASVKTKLDQLKLALKSA
jgi:F-type H+-transporting ATPase subunit delta